MKELTIVSKGKTEYAVAERLLAKISASGEFACQHWEEKKDYSGTKATISSENYIIYVGECKDAKALYDGNSIDWKYNNNGMKYGWIGKRAVLLVKGSFDINKLVGKIANKENAKNLAVGAGGFLIGGPLGAGITFGAKALFDKQRQKNQKEDTVKEKLLSTKAEEKEMYIKLGDIFFKEGLKSFLGE